MLATKPPTQPTAFTLPGYTHPVSKKMHNWHIFTYYAFHSWEKIIILILAIHTVNEIYKGSQFMISDYPLLKAHFSSHIVDTTEVRTILNEAIGVMLDTILNIVMAIRLSTAQERISRVVELILATALIIYNRQVIEFLQSLDYTFITQSVKF
jgi:hypothetical protein